MHLVLNDEAAILDSPEFLAEAEAESGQQLLLGEAEPVPEPVPEPEPERAGGGSEPPTTETAPKYTSE